MFLTGLSPTRPEPCRSCSMSTPPPFTQVNPTSNKLRCPTCLILPSAWQAKVQCRGCYCRSFEINAQSRSRTPNQPHLTSHPIASIPIESHPPTTHPTPTPHDPNPTRSTPHTTPHTTPHRITHHHSVAASDSRLFPSPRFRSPPTPPARSSLLSSTPHCLPGAFEESNLPSTVTTSTSTATIISTNNTTTAITADQFQLTSSSGSHLRASDLQLRVIAPTPASSWCASWSPMLTPYQLRKTPLRLTCHLDRMSRRQTTVATHIPCSTDAVSTIGCTLVTTQSHCNLPTAR